MQCNVSGLMVCDDGTFLDASLAGRGVWDCLVLSTLCPMTGSSSVRRSWPNGEGENKVKI